MSKITFLIILLATLSSCVSKPIEVIGKRNELNIPNFSPSSSIKKTNLERIELDTRRCFFVEDTKEEAICMKRKNSEKILFDIDSLIRENILLRKNMEVLETYNLEVSK